MGWINSQFNFKINRLKISCHSSFKFDVNNQLKSDVVKVLLSSRIESSLAYH